MNERMAAEAILDHLGALAEWLRDLEIVVAALGFNPPTFSEGGR